MHFEVPGLLQQSSRPGSSPLARIWTSVKINFMGTLAVCGAGGPASRVAILINGYGITQRLFNRPGISSKQASCRDLIRTRLKIQERWCCNPHRVAVAGFCRTVRCFSAGTLYRADSETHQAPIKNDRKIFNFGPANALAKVASGSETKALGHLRGGL